MGLFVTFEGIDGSGKTTQLRLLEEHLRISGVKVVVAREPGGTPVGEAIRQILLDSKTTHLRPLSELLLYYASRHQNLYQVVLPALDAGNWVLCDRYADASMAYQGYGRGIDLALVEQLNLMTIASHRPDLTILIDIDPAQGLARAHQRNRSVAVDEGRFEKESLEFYARVRQGYLEMARKAPQRFHIVEGAQPVEALQQEIRRLISPWLKTHHGA